MFDYIKADIQRYRRYGVSNSLPKLILENQGLWALICYRAGRHVIENPLPFGLRHLFSAFYFLWWKTVQMTTGIYLSPTAKIGKGFFVGHFGQIFIGADTTIGEDCNVAQGVTLGYAYNKGKWGVPPLGDRVFLAAGAKVIGPIHLANGTVVGANAVVTKSTEENAVMVGVPAKAISFKGSQEYI